MEPVVEIKPVDEPVLEKASVSLLSSPNCSINLKVLDNKLVVQEFPNVVSWICEEEGFTLGNTTISVDEMFNIISKVSLLIVLLSFLFNINCY